VGAEKMEEVEGWRVKKWRGWRGKKWRERAPLYVIR
jgi:hypothetical protein